MAKGREGSMSGYGLQSADANDSAAGLFTAMRSGETRALARAISLVESRATESVALLSLCHETLRQGPRALRIGITGPAGAGKSTLVDALTRVLRAAARRVGIVAVDPSSSISGGAILGDRIRMQSFPSDRGVYIRSMASRGHLGGLADNTASVLDVIEASWPQHDRTDGVLLIETVGVGQAEVEIASLADIIVVVLAPGMGDSIQSLKAGVLEIASVFVLNKADHEGMPQLESDIQELIALSAIVAPGSRAVPVLKTIATRGDGVPELWQAIQALPVDRRPDTLRQAELSPVLDHLGIAVRSLDAARAMYHALGIEVSPVEEVVQERVRVAMLATGQSRIELLEATSEDSVIGRYIARHGEGLHHVALRVPDLEQAINRLRQTGVRLVADTIQIGAGGHRYVFIHPSSANGVLLELVDGGSH